VDIENIWPESRRNFRNFRTNRKTFNQRWLGHDELPPGKQNRIFWLGRNKRNSIRIYADDLCIKPN